MNKEQPSKEYIDMWIEKVKNNPYELANCEFQTEEICLAAVKKDGRVLYYVKEQTFQII
jgi:hypothetical protein